MNDMNLPRLQHIVASGCVTAVGIWVTWLSYTQEPAAAYLFPRLISTVFAVLAIWTFIKACLGWTKVGAGLSGHTFLNMLPGLLVMLVYVFWAAKALGFYTATTVAFFVLFSLYDPAPHGALASWGKRIVATIIFIAVMYGLFAMLLKVYTPREMLF
jgi:hypothetical protein